MDMQFIKVRQKLLPFVSYQLVFFLTISFLQFNTSRQIDIFKPNWNDSSQASLDMTKKRVGTSL